VPESRQAFRAELQAGAVADIGLLHFETSSVAVAHTLRHVPQTDTSMLLVCRQSAGLGTMEQEGREAMLEPGDITLLDPRLPYAVRLSAASRMLILKVPRRLLEARVGAMRAMTARLIRPANGEGGLTSAFLAMLPAHEGKLGHAAEEIVRDQALDLLAVSLSDAMERQMPRLSSARSLALTRIRAAIKARLADPGLDARTVAAAAGVSIRYANAVLAAEGTSLMRLVQTLRLERCRRALEDPLQAGRTVSEIAYGWGFSDMTHFARKFRAAYGMSPSDYRRLPSQG
jgi:AraC-like DNA-binding protein